MKRAVERRLAAIVSADVKGYGLLMEIDEDGTLRRVGELMALLSRQIARFDGGVITVAGDGILAEFPTAVGAVRFGLVAQRRVQRGNARWQGKGVPDERKIALRIGIHAGEILVHDGRRGGEHLNLAVRIEQAADPGSVLISRAVYEQVRRKLSLRFEYLGEPPLKNVTKPIQLYRIVPPRRPAASDAPGAPGHGPAGDATGSGPPRPRPEADSRPGIAVLPFENLNGERRDEYLVNGITDDIITGLSRFRNLSVISRQSSFKVGAEQATPAEAARELGVRYLLTGSVRSAERRIRLNAQLVDASAARTVWAERYDAVLTDVLAVEDSVVQVIVARLAGQVEGAERVRLRYEETSDLAAYGHVLLGEEALWKRAEAPDAYARQNAYARQEFEQAIRRDPGYARAYAGLSRTYTLDWRNSWTPDPAAALDKAVALARQAVSKDRMDARGHSELAYSLLYKKELQLSLAEYAIALELNPNDADVMAEFADALVYDGRSEEAVGWLERAIRLNPLCPDWYYWHLGDAYSALGRYEDVIAAVSRMDDPGQCSRLLAASFAHLGRIEEARIHAAEVLRRQPGFRVSRWAEIVPQTDRERLGRFMDGLRKAGLPE